jgi:signal transduction histidine kinase
MTLPSTLNRISVRFAAAIALAIFLGLTTAAGLSLALKGTSENGLRANGSGSRFMTSESAIVMMYPRQNTMMLAGKIAMILRTAISLNPSDRERFISALTDPAILIEHAPSDDSVAGFEANSHVDWLGRLVAVQLDDLSTVIGLHGGRVSTDNLRRERPSTHLRETVAVLRARFSDGSNIRFVLPEYPAAEGSGKLWLISMTIVVIGVSIWMGHGLAVPIRKFAHGAERLGLDLTAPPIPVEGPTELRRTIRVVNQMQDRLRRFLDDRTQMLAAISHDLRAPLARLSLRVELATSGEHRQKMHRDLEVLNAMIDTTLTFARDDARQEPRRLVDLGVLIGDICEDISDLGGDVAYDDVRGISIHCRPTLLRRAVSNLIDNASKYGDRARVVVRMDNDKVYVVVDDDGPGILQGDIEIAFAPFRRIASERAPSKPGVGLGLTIARTIAREHGGDITLTNRRDGGLRAQLELPV